LLEFTAINPSPVFPTNSFSSTSINLPADTETIIRKKGLPDLQLKPYEIDPEDRLLLYQDDEDTRYSVDEVYYVDESGSVTHKITEVEKNEDLSETEAWFKEALEDVKTTIKDLKEQRNQVNRSVASLPGFNVFDRVDVLSREMELGLGKEADETLTTISIKPDKSSVNLNFRIPLN
jgi:nitrous oxide reductase